MIINNLLNIIQAWIAQGKVSVIIGLWSIQLFFTLLAFYMFYRRTLQLPTLPSIPLPPMFKIKNKLKL